MSVKDYLDSVYEKLVNDNPGQNEFFQAVKEIQDTLVPVFEEHPEYVKAGVWDRMVVPERTVKFRVAWVDDNGKVQVNTGYRVQFNSAIGPYKGGIRFHPSVNESIIKFLGFEQIFKNSLTTLPMGGGKGGSDFDPKGKSEGEVMRFCQAFMNELYRHIGPNTDVPAGDIGVGSREIGYMFGQYKKITNEFTGVLTGKSLVSGGSKARTQATGYGLCYFANELLKDNGKSFKGAKVVVSGSGNVALYACQKAQQLGATVVAMSDSNGYVYDETGIKFDVIQQLKEVERKRISEYAKLVPTAEYHEGWKGIWTCKCDIALPCATQNEIDLEAVNNLIAGGCYAVCEGSNMSSTPDAIEAIQKNGLLYSPGKASNAGGVATSGLEMTQNAIHLSWDFDEVDEKLQGIMKNIYAAASDAAKKYGCPGNILAGANIAGFVKVADAMVWQGVC